MDIKNTVSLTPFEARGLLYKMVLIRSFEEKAAEQYTRGKIRGFLHLYVGQEAIAVGINSALNPEDYILSTYREHGHALARGVSPSAIMAEMYGVQEGCTGGRGGSMHIFDVSHHFYGGNAIVAGHLPMATGMALASKKQQKSNITCCYFGEGAAAEGEFHEAMNLAALWQVPVLFVCENNLYAMGTALNYTHAELDLEKKAIGYGIPSASVDGMNLLEVIKAAKTAVKEIKETGQPYFLVCNTYRFRAHSMFDAELYRDKSEVEQWKLKDPIKAFSAYVLAQKLLDQSSIDEIYKNVESEIASAVHYAENGSLEPVENLMRFMYTEKKQ
jgi:pyruvate dehydrogenase E1 component alpha subunit